MSELTERFWDWIWRIYQRICRKRVRPDYHETDDDGEPNS